MSSFKKFIGLHGPAIKCRPVSEETIGRYEGILPPLLLELWRKVGWCGYGDGLLWVVNPDDLRDPLAEWLGPEAEESHAIVRTALGDVIFMNKEGTFYYLDVKDDSLHRISDMVEFVFEFTLHDRDFLNYVVETPLFRKAFGRLGIPEPDECYGFVPPLGLGGPGTAETLQRVKLREYLSILAGFRG